MNFNVIPQHGRKCWDDIGTFPSRWIADEQHTQWALSAADKSFAGAKYLRVYPVMHDANWPLRLGFDSIGDMLAHGDNTIRSTQ